MNTSGERLKNILLDGEFQSPDVEKLVDYLSKVGDALFYPRSVSMSAGLPTNSVLAMFSLLVAKGLLVHFSVPKHNGQVLTAAAVKGFQLKFDNIQDPLDYFPIDASEIEVISGFKIK